MFPSFVSAFWLICFTACSICLWTWSLAWPDLKQLDYFSSIPACPSNTAQDCAPCRRHCAAQYRTQHVNYVVYYSILLYDVYVFRSAQVLWSRTPRWRKVIFCKTWILDNYSERRFSADSDVSDVDYSMYYILLLCIKIYIHTSSDKIYAEQVCNAIMNSLSQANSVILTIGPLRLTLHSSNLLH